jgi:hypothetical protein
LLDDPVQRARFSFLPLLWKQRSNIGCRAVELPMALDCDRARWLCGLFAN